MTSLAETINSPKGNRLFSLSKVLVQYPVPPILAFPHDDPPWKKVPLAGSPEQVGVLTELRSNSFAAFSPAQSIINNAPVHQKHTPTRTQQINQVSLFAKRLHLIMVIRYEYYVVPPKRNEELCHDVQGRVFRSVTAASVTVDVHMFFLNTNARKNECSQIKMLIANLLNARILLHIR
jgi:hypothetical protein